MTSVRTIEDMTKEELVLCIQDFVIASGTEGLNSLTEYAHVLLLGQHEDATFMEGYIEGVNTVLEMFIESFKVTDHA